MNQDRMLDILRMIEERSPGSYLVGGSVRDALLDRLWEADLDLVVREDGFAIARWVAHSSRGQGSFVPLDDERGTGRVVFRWGATLDISRCKGPSVEEDLVRRDFTVNAIAVTVRDFLETGWSRLMDPLGGVADLRNRVIRPCSPGSFLDDPLRILRAFRLRASREMRLSRDTVDLLKEALPRLVGVSAERSRDELFSILLSEPSTPVLREMDQTGVIDTLFPELIPMKGCVQNAYHHLDVWDHTLETIGNLEQLLLGDPRFPEELRERIDTHGWEEPVRGRPKRALLKLAALFHDAGKPHTRTTDAAGSVHFYDHERVSRQIFNSVGLRMKLATRERELVGDWVEGHMRPVFLVRQPATRRAVVRLCRKFGGEVVGLFLLLLADLAASRGPARDANEHDRSFAEAIRAMETCRELEQFPPVKLLTGKDVLSLFPVEPGPRVGALLRHLEELQDSGEITTREAAIVRADAFLKEQEE